jgi:hypothetical protein
LTLKTECEWAKILIAAGKNIDPELYPQLIQGDRHIKDLASWYATMERSVSVMNRILSWARNEYKSFRPQVDSPQVVTDFVKPFHAFVLI